MDTLEVSVLHHPSALQRRVKDADRRWAVRDIPCPTPIMAYNKNKGGVDLSDQLIQYYSTHRKVAHWYKAVFLDIATTNAFILHREMSSVKQKQPMTHKNFMVELVCQLCGMDKAGVPLSRRADHVPVSIVADTDACQKATKGRLKCLQKDNMRRDILWKCQILWWTGTVF